MLVDNSVKSLLDRRHIVRGWGSKLDYMIEKGPWSKIPSKYFGLTFIETNHRFLDKFIHYSDKEKFEAAFWAEYQNGKSSFRLGLICGITIIVVIFFTIIGWGQE